MAKHKLHGSMVALVTPFKNGAVDYDAFQQIVAFHIKSGTHGVIPCGTTGETPTITETEHKNLISACVEAAAGRIPVIAGAGSNATETAVDFARYAEKAGADAILSVTPYYNKPTAEGIFQHYKAVNDKCGLPIILYNVPGRTGLEMSVDTVVRLATKLKRVAGIKDASVDLSRPLMLRRALGDGFVQLSGEDATVAAYLAQGGHGCISVTANVAPKLCADLHNAWQKKDWKKFEKIRDVLAPLHKAMFLETNPAPVKYAVSKLGYCRNEVRLPIVPVTPATRKSVDAAMAAAGLKKRK